MSPQNRKHEYKNFTRCGCKVYIRVHVNELIDHWYVFVFSGGHKHKLLNEQDCGLLSGHRKITATDAMQIENYRKVVIRPPHIYASLAQTSGGYNKVGYVRKDIYNYFARQGHEQSYDVIRALNYFHHLCSKDPMMVVAYIVDDENRLQHLFWCDAKSRMNYVVFGDVLAFDETYMKK